GGGILNKLRSNPFYYLLVPFFLIGQLWATIRLLRKERFDLIHAHWMIPQGLIAAIGLILTRRRIRMVCTSHGGDLFALRGTFFHHMKRWVMNRSLALTVVSRAMKEVVVDMGVAAEKVQVISMGVDLKNLFTPDPEAVRHEHHLFFVGRLVEVKGLQILLEAFPEILVKYPDLRLSVAGAGPMEEDLRRLAAQKKIAHRIDFWGMIMQEKLPELYQKAGLAVFPFVKTKSGVEEGFGLVVVEALGCECPVIAGDLPAIHDSIVHNESGLLFPSGNAEALAQAVIRAFADRDLRSRMGREGRRRVVEQFDWEIIAGKYAGLYQKVISG
ncbi:MAG: glycosyltransferase family 4 protein, partial [Deltaproteobacteria bacterium]|nr:glycosyltransferase family 4 protein [Deltaproteobacteria bacterium]